MRDLSILVAGGGIGGLTAALALLRAGNRVRVFEAAQNFGEVGAGVTMAPNAMLGYQFLGIGPQIEACGVSPRRQSVRHWQDGRVLKSLTRGEDMRERYGAPYLYVHRADLHAILLDAVREAGGETRVASRVTRAGSDEQGAWLDFDYDFRPHGDLLVGADGVRSVVRELFEPVSAHFTGHVVWRGIVDVDDDLRELAENPGNFIGPDRLVVWYPLRGGTQLNLVFFARQAGWTDDGWTIPARRAELETTFAGWHSAVQTMIERLDEDRLFKWAVNARTPLSTWNRDGRITLLGDAAHAMTPFLGQGASAAIEDAVVLARAIAASDSLPEGLDRYQAARLQRANMIQAESNANANRMQTKDADNFASKELRNEEALGLFSYDCGSVPV